MKDIDEKHRRHSDFKDDRIASLNLMEYWRTNSFEKVNKKKIDVKLLDKITKEIIKCKKIGEIISDKKILIIYEKITNRVDEYEVISEIKEYMNKNKIKYNQKNDEWWHYQNE